MAFNPSSTIYLCNVPIDSTYQNQIYFPDRATQISYFTSKVVKTFSDYLTVRKTLPNGSLESSVKVAANIDDLQKCNYMCYQNANHGAKWFYAFITKLIYVNENTTQIVFETDVYQTWLTEVELKPSYVVREHSETDEIGDNVVPESFTYQDYEYAEISSFIPDLNNWGYLVGLSEDPVLDLNAGRMQSGIFQGLVFRYYHEDTNLTSINNLLDDLDKDIVVFIACIPRFSVTGSLIGSNDQDKENGVGYLYASTEPATKTYRFNANIINSFGNYTPLNNKLFTAPFCKMVITNHSGDQAEYNIEDFANRANIEFKMYGDISANPSITLVPKNYKRVLENYDFGISIKNFPQVSYTTDTFKLWLAKNQGSLAIDGLTNIGQIVAGIATLGTGAGAPIGAGMIVSGATGVLNTANSVYKASKEPNGAHTGGAQNNLLTAMGKNKFELYIQTIKEEYARTVDDFFTMYGYQTNKLKQPNVSSRPYFNYVQTVDVNIVPKTGGIPNDDMRNLKAMYNKGVTFWKHTSIIGDYTQVNTPK